MPAKDLGARMRPPGNGDLLMRLASLSTCLLLPLLLLAGRAPAPETRPVTIRLVDAQSGAELPGLIRVTAAKKQAVPLPSLLNRGVGLLENQPRIGTWSVLPRPQTVALPQQAISIEAISGLETERSRIEVDLTDKAPRVITLKLKRFYSAAEQGLRAANTHLHLMKISRKDCDRYLREIPRADGLDMIFLSYLERAGAAQRLRRRRRGQGERGCRRAQRAR